VVPRITSKGKSFKGAGAYFLHDLKAQTTERVAFTHTENMLTNDPDVALKVMAWTAEHARELKEISGQKLTGRQAENPVYTYCLAWAPDQNPDQAHMIAFGRRSLKVLGLADHEAVFIAHNDTDHLHLHVIANRVHPETGLMAKMSQDRLALSRLAQSYEQETGQVYCHARVANNEKRERGAWVKAEKEVRQTETPEYQEKRAARIEAQRQAGQLAKGKARAKEVAEQGPVEANRDMRAAFDQASAPDDRRYRARELDRPAGDEHREARAAWAAERTKEREEARFARREAARRSFLEERRARAWADYEAAQWQALYDKQTTRRDGLEAQQLDIRRRLEDRLSAKYGQSETLIERRLAAAQAECAEGWLKGTVDRLTGRQGRINAQRDLYTQAKTKLEGQKEAERQALAERQAEQRTRQRERQAAEQQRLGVRLQERNQQQEAAHRAREEDRTQRLALKRARPPVPGLESPGRSQAVSVQQNSDRGATEARKPKPMTMVTGRRRSSGLDRSR
jgi:Relaxase/Mobilisation nuclease domain